MNSRDHGSTSWIKCIVVVKTDTCPACSKAIELLSRKFDDRSSYPILLVDANTSMDIWQQLLDVIVGMGFANDDQLKHIRSSFVPKIFILDSYPSCTSIQPSVDNIVSLVKQASVDCVHYIGGLSDLISVFDSNR